MGIVNIKHPDVEGIGECHTDALGAYEARGWSLFDPAGEPPDEAARKSVWAKYGADRGMTEEELDGMTKADIIAHTAAMPRPALIDPNAPSSESETVR